MIVHFVCEGNNFRSRLAETYLNSMNNPKIQAISNGIIPDVLVKNSEQEKIKETEKTFEKIKEKVGGLIKKYA